MLVDVEEYELSPLVLASVVSARHFCFLDGKPGQDLATPYNLTAFCETTQTPSSSLLTAGDTSVGG